MRKCGILAIAVLCAGCGGNNSVGTASALAPSKTLGTYSGSAFDPSDVRIGMAIYESDNVKTRFGWGGADIHAPQTDEVQGQIDSKGKFTGVYGSRTVQNTWDNQIPPQVTSVVVFTPAVPEVTVTGTVVVVGQNLIGSLTFSDSRPTVTIRASKVDLSQFH